MWEIKIVIIFFFNFVEQKMYIFYAIGSLPPGENLGKLIEYVDCSLPNGEKLEKCIEHFSEILLDKKCIFFCAEGSLPPGEKLQKCVEHFSEVLLDKKCTIFMLTVLSLLVRSCQKI